MNLKPETAHLIGKLEQYYKHDVEGMKTLATLKRAPSIIRQYEVLRENPIVSKIAKEALSKLEMANESLLGANAWNMSEEERIFNLVTRDWAIWFLTALGEDPEQQVNMIENQVRTLAERAGLIPKG